MDKIDNALMEFSREDTKMIQGVSVLAMLCLHLFCTYDYEGLFNPLFFVKGLPLCFYFAQLSDFCVFGFALCSGYGHYAQYEKQDSYLSRLKGLGRVCFTYWVVLISFVIICMLIGQQTFMPGSFKRFILNFFALDNLYNGAWWYMLTYSILVIISPAILRLVQRHNPLLVLLFGFIVYCIAYYVRFNIISTNWILSIFGPFGMTLFEHVFGAECRRTKVLSAMYKRWDRFSEIVKIILPILVILVLLYFRAKVVQSLFVAPISGTIIIVLFHFWDKSELVKNVFLFIGKHSTNIWLTHMFFIMKPFSGLVYVAKYPFIIFFFMIGLTVSLSMVLKYIEKSLLRILPAF